MLTEELNQKEEQKPKKEWCVYIHTNKINGKKYVGITCQEPKKRWSNGKGYSSNKHFKRAIDLYGWENFEHEIFAEHLSSEDACELESQLIAELKTNNTDYGYNNTAGGFGFDSYVRTEAARIASAKAIVEALGIVFVNLIRT